MSVEVEVVVPIYQCYGLYETAAHGSFWGCRRFGYVYGNGGVVKACVDWGNDLIPCSFKSYYTENGYCYARLMCRVPLRILEIDPGYRAMYACVAAWAYVSTGGAQVMFSCRRFEVS